jgi:hypothetical protein
MPAKMLSWILRVLLGPCLTPVAALFTRDLGAKLAAGARVRAARR